MPLQLWRDALPDDPSTKVQIFLKANDVGPYSVLIGGVGGNVDTTGTSNTATTERTGLEPDTEYEISIDGTVVGTVKTTPAPGSPAVICTTNCFEKRRNFLCGKQITDRADFMIWGGDQGYPNYDQTKFRDLAGNHLAVTDADPANASTPTPQSEWEEHLIQWESIPGIRRVNQRMPQIFLESNHDRGGGIDDLSVYSFYANGSAMGNQGIANNAYRDARNAIKTYRPDLPAEPIPTTRDVAEATQDAGYTANVFDPRYGSVVVGCVEIFFLDTISGKGRNTRADLTNYMLGPEQEAWLIAAVNASEQPWKLITTAHALTAVPLTPSIWTNGWHVRQTQLKRILDAFTTTGIVWDGHDFHAFSLQVGNAPYKYAGTNTGNGGIAHNENFEPFTPAGELGGDSIYAIEPQYSMQNQTGFAEYRFTPDSLELVAHNMRGQETLRVTMNAGSNTFNEGAIQRPIANKVYFDSSSPAALGYDTPASEWFPDADPIPVHGWSDPPGGGALDLGVSFLTNLPTDFDCMAACLELKFRGDSPNISDLKIQIDRPGADNANPWSASYLPRFIDTSFDVWDVDLVLSTDFPGVVRINVTDKIRNTLADVGYAQGHYFNFTVYLAGANDDVDFERFARLIILERD